MRCGTLLDATPRLFIRWCDAARTALGAQSALVYVEKYLVLRTIQMIQQIPLLAFPAKAGIHSAVGTGFRR
jgi:hypothetical protein